MKWTNYLFITFLFFIYTCKSETETSRQKVTFGIHEMVQTNEIPGNIINEIQSMNVQIEDNPAAYVIGYILKDDTSVISMNLSDQHFRIVRTIYTVDNEQKHYAVAAVRTAPVVDNSYIKKAKAKGNNIEVYFNMEGATKWAKLTKENIGKPVAFILDNRIYTIPLINAEIRSGMAVINGISSDSLAKEIAEALSDE